MNFYPLFVDRQVSEPRIDPPARVVIMNTVLFHVNGLMRVSAQNSVNAMLPCITQGARCHLRRHSQPARIQTVDASRDWVALEIQLLQLQEE
jgi:hypothetical protein